MAEIADRPTEGTVGTGRRLGRLLAERDLRVLASVLPFLLEFRFRVAISVTLLLASTGTSLLVPWLLKLIVDDLDTAQMGPVLTVPIALLLAYGFARLSITVFGELRNALFGTVTVRAMRRVSLKVLAHLHDLDLEYHLSRRTGGVSRDLDRGVNGITELMRVLVFSIFPTLLQIGGIAIILLVNYDAAYAGIVAVAAVVYIVFTLRVTEWRTQFIRRSNDANSRANTRAIDSLINYETVKYFGNETLEQDAYDQDLAEWERWRARNRYSLAFLNCGQALFVTVGMLAMMILAAGQVVSGDMTLGDLVLINAFSMQVFAPLNALGSVYRQLKRALTDVERMVDILDRRSQVVDAPNALPLEHRDARIEFDSVDFAYHADRPILRDVSFVVEPGQKVALVGPSGAGKSTVARLLYRFYDVDAGAVRINGHDVRELKQDSLRAGHRRRTAGCGALQRHADAQPALRPVGRHRRRRARCRGTGPSRRVHRRSAGRLRHHGRRAGAEALGRREAAHRHRPRHPQAAGLHALRRGDLVARLEHRAGHPGSARRSGRDRTTVVIAHRLSTVQDADLIIVLDEGVVRERGTHDELLARKSGLYAELWAVQQRGGEGERAPEH